MAARTTNVRLHDRRADRAVPRPATPGRGPRRPRQPEPGPGRRRPRRRLRHRRVRHVRRSQGRAGQAGHRGHHDPQGRLLRRAVRVPRPHGARHAGPVPGRAAPASSSAAAARPRPGERPASPTGSCHPSPRCGSSTGTRCSGSAVPIRDRARSARTAPSRWPRTSRRAGSRSAPFFLHEANAYGTWQAQERGRLAVPLRRRRGRAAHERAVRRSHSRAVRRRVARSAVPVRVLPPAVRGMPFDLAWSSLHLFENHVLPAFGAP